MAEILESEKYCANFENCKKTEAKFKCKCKLVLYCCKKCQVADWPFHKKEVGVHSLCILQSLVDDSLSGCRRPQCGRVSRMRR